MNTALDRRLYDHEMKNGATVRCEQAKRSAYLGHLVRRHFPRNRDAVILDIGCGAGQLLSQAASMGYRNIFGVEGSALRVAAAQADGLSNVVCGDLQAHLAALPPHSHDMIVAFDVLEHFGGDDLLALTDAVGAALRPGGRWLIHVPNGASPFFGQVFHGDLTHKTAFTADSLRWLLMASGFREAHCYEDVPVVHGVKSLFRRAGWAVLRAALRCWTMIETGDAGRDAVLTRCFLTIAVK